MPTKFFNTFLRFFGLITIDRARKIHIELVALRERTIMKDAQADFGVLPRAGFEEETRTWATQSFNQILSENKNEIYALTEDEAIEQGIYRKQNDY